MTDEQTIRSIVELIVEQFDPVRIVLFGSHARGDADENSDLDLLVEMPAGWRPNGSANPIREAIAERFVLPIDVIVRHSDAVERYRTNRYSLVGQAFADGVILYERRAA